MLVSILVPVYGVEQYIERCARSMFEQTYPNLEYVFVNDCTPDLSMEVLHKVMMDYPQRKDAVHAINHDRNRGLAAARTESASKYLEYGKKIIVKEPSPAYVANPLKKWNSFPTQHQHGNISMEVKDFSIKLI